MLRGLPFFILGAVLTLNGVGYAQAEQLGDLLLQLESSDPEVRSEAFYKLPEVGMASEDRIKSAVISLLIREQVYKSSGTFTDNAGERFGTYFGDLLQAVVSLQDTRALDPLLGVIQTGRMAMSAIAGFGVPALDPVIVRLDGERRSVRHAATLTLGLMLAPDNFPKVCDPISKDKIRTALTKASTDADRNVAGAGLDALNRLAQVDIPGDVNGDLQVDCGDMAVVRAAFGKETDQPGFDRRADVNVDGLVDSRDLLAVRQHLASGTQCADFSPPVIGGLPVASTCILWPPNKALVEVATVTGNDQFGLASFNVSVSSDEPSGSENPDTAVLGIGVGPRIVQLRADRLGNGNGRLYTITATATNVAGITATASSTCSVPHDQGR